MRNSLATRSIQRRLIIQLLLATLAGCVVCSAAIFWYLRGEIMEQSDAALQTKARSVSEWVRLDQDGRIHVDMPQHGRSSFRAGGAEYYQVLTLEEGSPTVIARSPSLADGELPAGPKPKAGKARGAYDLILPDSTPGRAGWVQFVALSPEAPDSARDATTAPARRTLIALVAATRQELDETLSHLLIFLACMTAVVSTATIFVVTSVVRRGLRLLQAVANDASRPEVKTLEFRFPTKGLPVELQPIAERLNDLLERLSAAVHRERRFSASVSHELRTPIAEMRSIAEVALRYPSDASVSSRSFASVVKVAEQMESKVVALLQLVRSESGRQQRHFEPLALAELVREVYRESATAAQARSLTHRLVLPEHVTVRSDPTMLKALVGNLLSNAACHAPAGSVVTVAAEESPDAVRLVVTNPAGDLAEADIVHLGEPFWRKDAARSDGMHCGLGLSLVRAYAAVLGGSVTFSVHDGQFSAALSLPSAATRLSDAE